MQLSLVRLICINLCTQKSFVTTRHAKKSASNTWACKLENASTENATAKRSTVVSRFSELSPSPQKYPLNRDSPLNRIIPMIWFDHFCCQPSSKNSPLNRDNPLNRSPLNQDTTVFVAEEKKHTKVFGSYLYWLLKSMKLRLPVQRAPPHSQ